MKLLLSTLMTLLIPIVMFAQPCTVNDASGCACEDGSTDCYLLPNIKVSYDLLADPSQNPESPGELRISASTPNVGHGPLRIIPTDNFVCGVDTFFNSNITICPDGSDPSQLVKQRIYRKQGNTMTYEDRWAGSMTYHPSHAHTHFDDWGTFSLRIPDDNEPNPLNWQMVSDGTKLSFCLMDFGSCSTYDGHCRDDNNNILRNSDFPNYGLGGGDYSCGLTNQGISVGWTDIYGYQLDGMHITIPNGVCNGDYAVVVQVDPNNLLVEENDNDNLVVVPVTLTQQTNCDGGGGNDECNDNAVSINITLDNYPAETTWSITNSNGTTVASSNGNYGGQAQGSTVTEDVCLPNGCFDFTINDSYGDGICCGYGNGSYTVTDANGNVLASGGDFGSSETKNFCFNGQQDPCAGNGGDADGDGVCANVDCNDNNANIGAQQAPGAACNDNNPNTTNDVIQSDGCTCAGTALPCTNAGGDADGDGVCANVDCNDNNANIGAQQTPGTACNDNNSNTINDVIQSDGCTCTGTPDNGGGGCNDNPVTINITLDNYPEETSWSITNENGATVASSNGTYSGQADGSTVTEDVCLPNGCFDFTINDAYGDGICCGYGNGSYTITGANGNVLASGGDFGSSETKNFCFGNGGGGGGCTTYDSENFDSWGIWNDGGSDSRRSSDYAAYANTGTYCVRLRDNSGQASSMYTDVLNLSGYSSLDISFSFITNSMETGEDFFLEMSTNGGSSYTVIQNWVADTDFTNGIRYNETVVVGGFSSSTVFRIRCDASGNNDLVYIDDVVIEDCGSEVRLENVIEAINIFPNPSTSYINVDLHQIVKTLDTQNIEVTIFSLNGQVLYQNEMQPSNTLQLNIETLPASQMYLLHLRMKDGRMFRGKFVKF